MIILTHQLVIFYFLELNPGIGSFPSGMDPAFLKIGYYIRCFFLFKGKRGLEKKELDPCYLLPQAQASQGQAGSLPPQE